MIRQGGFSLLEAVVAMVLISGAGAALFSWINTELGSVARLQQINSQAETMLNVLEFMQTVNPMLTPEGDAPLARLTVTWKSNAVTEVQDGVSYPAGVSLYQLALYDTLVSVMYRDGTPWFSFTLRQVGYKRVRDNKQFLNLGKPS